MSTVSVSIIEDSNPISVVAPVITEEVSNVIENCKDLMGIYRAKLAHEEPFANCTSDMVAHI